MKWYWWIGIIIAVALSARAAFGTCHRWYRTSGDTVSYYLTGRLILTNHRISDPWRTPVYPLLIALPFILEGKEMPPMLNQGVFTPELWYLRLAQGVAGLMTLVILFFLLRELKVSSTVAGLYAVFTACSWIFMFSEYQLSTETFAMFFLMLSMLLVVLLLRRFSVWKYIVLVPLTILQVFLRPSNILLPLIYCGVLVWHHRTRAVILAVIILMVFYSGIMFVYMHANEVYAGYRGISRISDMNLLGKIYAYRLSFDKTPNEAGIKSLLASYNAPAVNPSPWPVLNQYPQLYDAKYAAPIHKLVTDMIKNNFGIYVVRSVKDIPGALLDKSMLLDNVNTTNTLGPFLTVLGNVYITIQILDILLFIAVPLYAVASRKKRTIRTDGLLLFSVIGLYYLLIGSFLSYNDYTRLFSIAQPFMLFVSGLLLVSGIQKAGNLINKRSL